LTLLFQYSRHHLAPHSFPTRRSSDLQLSSVFFLVFPVAAALIWSTAQRTGLYDAPFWATTSFGPHLAGWLSILLVAGGVAGVARSEEHTSELQSRSDLVCRLLLEKKN